MKNTNPIKNTYKDDNQQSEKTVNHEDLIQSQDISIEEQLNQNNDGRLTPQILIEDEDQNTQQENQPLIDPREREEQKNQIFQESQTNENKYNKEYEWKDFNFYMNTSLIGQFFLFDTLKLLFKSAKDADIYKKLSIKNLPHLFPHQRIEYTHKILQNYLDEVVKNYNNDGKPIQGINFVWIFLKIYKEEITLNILLSLFCLSSKIYSTLQIKYLIQSIEKNGVDNEAYLCTLKLNIAMIFYSLIYHNTTRINQIIFSQFRNSIMKALYLKISSLSSHSMKESNLGKLINLIANDLVNIENRFNVMISIFIAPFPLFVISYIIYISFGFVGLIGLFIMTLTGALQIFVSSFIPAFYEQKSRIVDERVNMTNEIIKGISLIKMHAWEESFQQNFKKLRYKEINKNTITQILSFISHSIEVVSCLFGAIVLFSLVYYFGNKHNFDYGTIFSTFDLLLLIKLEVIFNIGQGIQGFYLLQVVLQRIVSMIISTSQMQCIFGSNIIQSSDLEIGNIKFENFTAYWKENKPILQDINISIKKGEFICIVGRIGSGKTSLLSCILQEIPYYYGNFNFNGKLAFVEQEPYIFSCSLKENIIFGKEFDEQLYQSVIISCCLEQDINQFDQGDETQIGEGGYNISGGQKARISLARALYSQADIYLLDDPLSAVDARVQKNLFFDGLKIHCQGSTVLLVTHQIHFAEFTDKTLILDDGKIQNYGTYPELNEELQTLSLDLSYVSDGDTKSYHKLSIDGQQLIDEIQIDDVIQDSTNIQKLELKLITKQNNENLILKSDDQIQKTKVSFQTYSFLYNMSSFPFTFIFIIGVFASSEIVFIIFNKQLGNLQTENKETLFEILWWILLVYFLIQILKSVLITLYFNNCSQNLHEKMMNSILRATILFFNMTSQGDILNHFTTDIGLIDGSLVTIISDVLEFIMQVVLLLGAVAFITPYFVIIGFIEILLILLFVIFTQHSLFYTKQLDLNLKAPLFSFFNVVLSGILQIKVYNKQQYFENKFDILANNSLRASWYFYLSSRGFGSQISLIATITNAFGIFLIISVMNSGPLIGQAIIFLIVSTESMQFGIRQTIQMDVTMQSTQRCKNLVEEKSEPQLKTLYDQMNIQNNRFPSNGQVIFNNVKMRYNKEQSLVLKGISFQIQSGRKVGLVGRTGAGKSSIIQALFRMTEIESDSDINILNEQQNSYQIEINVNENGGIFIDGHNIQNLGLHTLRSGISIIPQFPFVFSGTFRCNIDPLNEFSDEKIIDILKDIQLFDKVNDLENKLYTKISSTEQIFSTGQKQLICLGRAILKQSPLLILDEATSNCDILTDELIQQKIRQRFENSTILTIAHRINTVADYDQVIVLDQGQVVEQGTPYELLQKQNGFFYKMVTKTGQANQNTIRRISKEKFKQNNQSIN